MIPKPTLYSRKEQNYPARVPSPGNRTITISPTPSEGGGVSKLIIASCDKSNSKIASHDKINPKKLMIKHRKSINNIFEHPSILRGRIIIKNWLNLQKLFSKPC